MRKENEKERKADHQYPTNKIEIDCVLFNFEEEILKILLVKQEDDLGNISWGLANDWIKDGETISSTARNILKKYIGVDHFFLEQLKAFGYRAPSSEREDISIGYYALVKKEKIISEEYKTEINPDIMWIGINEIAGLSDKHKVIVDFSLQELRKSICNSAVGFNLLPEKFTLLQVIHLYQEILGIEVNKSNFRRKILQMGIVSDSNEKEEDVSHRAAKFYSIKVKTHEMLSHQALNFNF